MGEGLDEVAFNDARAPLDGVGGAKNAVDVVLIFRVLFQSQQA